MLLLVGWFSNTTSLDLRGGIRELEVAVHFHARNHQNDETSAWCDDIELFIDYDIAGDEPSRSELSKEQQSENLMKTTSFLIS